MIFRTAWVRSSTRPSPLGRVCSPGLYNVAYFPQLAYNAGMRTLFILVVPVLVLGACSRPQKFVQQRYQMATTTQIQVLALPQQSHAVSIAINNAFDAIDQVEQVASWFIPTSDPCRIADAAPGTTVTVSPLMMRMLTKARELTAATSGRYDVSAGPLIRLWGFGPDTTNHVPSKAQIAAALQVSGMDTIVLLPEQNAVSTVVAGVQIDVSSLAAGLAADQAARVLQASGFSDFLVNAGGEIRTSSSGNKIWHVGIQVPTPASAAGEYISNRVLELRNQSVSTSGSYQKFFSAGSNTYTHIVNPVSGYPVRSETISVTVIAPECIDADGWSTALFCLPAAEAIALVDRIPDLACLIVKRPLPGDTALRFLSSTNFPVARP